MMFYVYIYKDPITNDPFYIGKGKNNRWKVHLTESKENITNQRKYDRIQSLKKQKLKPIIEIHSYYNNENEAYDVETTLIKKYGRIGFEKDGILTNIFLNGRPNSLALKGKTWEEIYGKERAKELKQNLRQVNLGKKQSKETIDKKVKKAKEQKRSEEFKQNQRKILKGKTYEEIYGLEKASQLREIKRNYKHSEKSKQKISIKGKGRTPWNKGKRNENE